MGDARVPAATAALLTAAETRTYLSAACAWEISIKIGLGRLRFPERPEVFVPEARERLGIHPLPIDEIDALQVGKLPRLHRDPFDRMLVAQAIVKGWPIATPDPLIQAYPCRTLWPK